MSIKYGWKLLNSLFLNCNFFLSKILLTMLFTFLYLETEISLPINNGNFPISLIYILSFNSFNPNNCLAEWFKSNINKIHGDLSSNNFFIAGFKFEKRVFCVEVKGSDV